MALLIALWALYLAYIGYQVQDWMSMRSLSSNLEITDRFFMSKIGGAAAILVVSVVLRLLNQVLAAKIVAAVPVGVTLIALTWMVLVWLFVWLAFFIGSK